MAKKIALLISVRNTLLPYSNVATSGVDAMANNLQYASSNAFSNVRMIQHQVKKQRIINSIIEVSQELSPGGFCLIYYHGHGDSITGSMENDEIKDQALVCYDGYLLDDEIDQLLRGFHPTCRILSIFDCCSSNTLVEWKYTYHNYPNIIHIASADDNGYALASTMGGVMSQQIINMIDGWAFSNYTYINFIQTLKNRMNHIGHPLYIRTSPGVKNDYLNLPLFN